MVLLEENDYVATQLSDGVRLALIYKVRDILKLFHSGTAL